ncbi:hypothetical protein PQR63_23085 [Herbaspirillum rhizosphaerae]|uniref:Uncharacterized protein n=1 Tax=Herbaspirillum rhizosphaerae TaxID=346179 RepID=A0ABW8ZE56_9BURK
MAVPSVITDLNVTAASNSPAGTDPIGSSLDDFLRAAFSIVRREQAQGAAIASAATTSIGGNSDGNYLHITGTTTITSLGTIAAGVSRTVVFDGSLTLTHNSTSLILPGAANIVTAAGDIAEFVSEGSGNWRCVKYVGGATASGVVGSTRNLRMAVTTTGATATVTADEIIIESSLGGSQYRLANFSKPINLATTGAGGMDTGTAPVSGYVAIYAILNPATATSALLAVNATSAAAPSVYAGANMPSGYIASGLLTVVPTNASSQFPILDVYDRHVDVSPVAVVNGGTATSYTSIPISSAVPKNAVAWSGLVGAAATSNTTTVSPRGTLVGQIIVYTTSGGQVQVPISMKIAVAQTLYYYGASGNLANITISGYDI